MVWKKTNYTFDPKSTKAFKISRSKIDLFNECPRCFYLDRRLGVSRPSMPGFSLNDAVDKLLKKEFDLLRHKGIAHEIMKQYGVDAVPYEHADLEIWRDNFKGQTYYHSGTNLIITGAIDDLWVNSKNELHIVEYKSTSTERVISLEDTYKQGYKRQVEIYQWIFQKNGYSVSDLSYFVFANAGKNRPNFDGKLVFNLVIIPYKGNCDWVENTIKTIKKCLMSPQIPMSGANCEYCNFVNSAISA